MQPNIAKNTSWFFTALIIQKIIAFVYFTYLARILGAENIGHYIFALSYITIFTVIIDFGTNHFITREVAKNKNKAQEIASNIFGFKIISSLFAVALALIAAILLGYEKNLLSLLSVAVLVMVVESFVLSIFAIIRGFHNLKYESISTILVHLLIMVLGIIVARLTKNISWLLAVLLFAHTLNLLYGLFLLKYKFRIKLKLSFNISYWKKIFLVILPFAMAAAFAKIWGAADQLILARLSSPEQLGCYGVAFKLTFALQFLPMALLASLYPAMSRFFVENKEKLKVLFSRAINYLLLITLPLSAGVFIFAPYLIISLYTDEYRPAILPLRILFLGLTFIFLNFIIGALLNASNLQKRQSVNVGISMVVSIVLNLILIPKFNASGAALAAVISNSVYFILGWLAIRKVFKYDYKKNLFLIFRIILAVVIMTVFSLVLINYIYWVWAAILTALLYFGCLFLFKVFSPKEIKSLINSFRV